MNNHHTTEFNCPLCAEKLGSAHETLQSWFWDVKKEFPDVHISCTWRDREAQTKAFLEGKTCANWPHSKHNKVRDGSPCSHALDLFQLVDGAAIFRPRYFGEIHRFNQTAGFPIQWGGKFRAIRDCPHFELGNEEKYEYS